MLGRTRVDAHGVTSVAGVAASSNGCVEAMHLEHEVGADLRARLATRAAREQQRIAVPAAVVLVRGHHQYGGRTGVDAQVAALARLGVDHHRTAGQDALTCCAHVAAPTASMCRRPVASERPGRPEDADAGTAATTPRGRRRARPSRPGRSPRQYAPTITSDALTMLPPSTARSVAGTPYTVQSPSSRPRSSSNTEVLTNTRLSARNLRSHRQPVVVMHEDRRPRRRHHRRRLDRAVGEHQRGVGVAAAHHAAVAPEHQHLEALDHRPAGEHLGGELDPLTADAGRHQRSLHQAPPTSRTRVL